MQARLRLWRLGVWHVLAGLTCCDPEARRDLQSREPRDTRRVGVGLHQKSRDRSGLLRGTSERRNVERCDIGSWVLPQPVGCDCKRCEDDGRPQAERDELLCAAGLVFDEELMT